MINGTTSVILGIRDDCHVVVDGSGSFQKLEAIWSRLHVRKIGCINCPRHVHTKSVSCSALYVYSARVCHLHSTICSTMYVTFR